MAFVQSSPRERLGGALAAAIVPGLIGYALIVGLAIRTQVLAVEPLATFAVLPDRPPAVEKVKPHKVVSRRAEGAASPPNLRSKATAVTAPPPIVPPLPPPPIVAAEKPGIGNQTMSGNAEIRGPGTGSGGVGDGTGSGRYGDGAGNGGRETPPLQTKGRIKDSDWPHDLADSGVGGTVTVRYVVTVAGRAADCEVTRSSGTRALDILTCQLIEQRFRFKPSLDEDGRPVDAVLIEDHTWVNGLQN